MGNVHVLLEGAHWKIVQTDQVLGLHDTRQDAVEEGRRLAAEAGVDLVVLEVGGEVAEVIPES